MFWKIKKKEKEVILPVTPVEDLPVFKKKLDDDHIKRFLLFLKTTYDYDTATYYHFEKPYMINDYDVLDDALGYATFNNLHQYGISDDKESIKNFRDRILSDFVSIQLVHLTRKYESTRSNAYIFMYSVVDDDNNIRILLPKEYNLFSLFKVPEYNDTFGYGVQNDHFINDFLEYVEKNTDNEASYSYFQHVTELTVPVMKNPIISFNHEISNSHDMPERMAQIIIKYYPENEGKILYKLDMKLCHGKKIIKHSIMSDIYTNRLVNKFIFPLNQTDEQLTELGLEAYFTAEFMNQDFTPFWDINDMLKI